MKNRLDKLLFDKGLSVSREKGRSEIVSGWVKVNGETVRDPSRKVDPDAEITVNRPGGLFVSRGGEKLAKALAYFSIDVRDLICADLGASTGGFTDCLLKNGAKKVYAVDVGYGQLDYSLRKDERVVVIERYNARNIEPTLFNEPISFVVSDLSFISFTKVYPAIKKSAPDACGVSLIKPQFESEPHENKKGIVRSADLHVEILSRVFASLDKTGITITGLTFSPIKGPKGNIEFLIYYSVTGEGKIPLKDEIEAVVREAHQSLSSHEENELTASE